MHKAVDTKYSIYVFTGTDAHQDKLHVDTLHTIEAYLNLSKFTVAMALNYRSNNRYNSSNIHKRPKSRKVVLKQIS